MERQVQGAGGGAGRPPPPQGRVPGDALARAAQPAVADPQRRASAPPRQGDENLIQQEAREHHRAAGGATLAPHRRPAGGRPLHQRQGPAGPGAARPPGRRGAVGGVASSPLIERRGHALTVDLPGGPIWLEADPSRLEQVVGEPAQQRRQVHRRGGAHLADGRIRREGGEAVVGVRDTGVGIDLEKFPAIFDLFTQADRSLDRSRGG